MGQRESDDGVTGGKLDSLGYEGEGLLGSVYDKGGSDLTNREDEKWIKYRVDGEGGPSGRTICESSEIYRGRTS